MKNQLEDINAWFENLGKRIVKFRWIILIAFIVITIIAGFGLNKIKLDNSIEGWFLEGAEIKKAQDKFEELFGNNDYVAFLVEAEDVFAPEILTMIRNLGEELENSVPFADKVISIADMEFSRADGDDIIIENLVPDPILTNPEDIKKIKDMAFAKEQLVNRMYSDDSKQTWIMLRLYTYPDDWEEKGEVSPINQVGFKILEILNQEKYKKYSIKSAGMPVMAVEEMELAEKEMGKLTLIAIILSIIILFIFLRSLRGVIIPLITTISSIIIVFGFMGHLGLKINATVMSVPVFIGFAVSIGYSIHLFNFFKRNLFITGKRKESVYYSFKQSGWPLLFTAFTTIASLLSFYFVSLVPIQWLGLTSAAVIFTVYIVVMALTPVLLSLGKDKIPNEIILKKGIWTDKYFVKFGEWVLNHSIPIIIIFAIIVGAFIYGLTKIEINVDIKRTYGNRVPYVNRMVYVANSKIGSLMSYDLTLSFNETDTIKNPEILKKFEEFINKVQKLTVTKKTSSILDIIKDMNQLLNGDDPQYYRIPDNKKMIAQLLFLYELSGGTDTSEWVDNNYSVLRLMVEVDDMDALEIKKDIEFLKKTSKEIFPEAQLLISGSMPQVAALNYYVATGQVKSFLIALVVIMLLLMIVFRSIKTGLIGIIPNITPAIIIGGLMGFLNIPLDFFTITMMPMILGLAVDDTIHFISHSHLAYNTSGNYKDSILQTFKMVGKALFITTFIIMASFSIYLTSIFNMFINLGIFIIVGIASALIADYLVTPVLLNWTKPFGRMKTMEKKISRKGKK